MAKPLFWLICPLFLVAGVQAQEDGDKQGVAQAASMERYGHVVKPFFGKYCNACHGPKDPDGDLDLGRLDPNMQAASAARWAMVLDRLVDRKMPPEGEPQPGDQARMDVTEWIRAEMKRAGKHLARREVYTNGNQVPHDLLFGSGSSAAFDAPARVRQLSPEIYEARSRDVAKDAQVGQPFSPAGNTTFKDMGTSKIDEPVTVQLLRDALVMVEKQTSTRIDKGKVIWTGVREFQPLFDEKSPPSDSEIEAAINAQFERVLRRKPTDEERTRFVTLLRQNVRDAGFETGVRYTLAAVFLLPDAIFRWELGEGDVDEQGRVRLAPREIAFALTHALTDRQPEGWLLAEADQGKLGTREGVETAVRRMLGDPKLQKPRILRFFREYFQYDKATEVFKDGKQFSDHDARVLVEDTDRLIEYILEQDKNVLYQLLTTNKSFVAYKTAADTKKKRAEALAKFEADKKKDPKKYENKTPPKLGRSVYESYSLTDFPDRQPTELPAGQRAGILTQPAWLVAWSKSDENDAIRRGKWVRERLLGGVVPDVPITVDAQLPNDPTRTLRDRMQVTRQEYCWKCHTLMNRVGLPFEMYDHFGRFRASEPVLDPEATEKNVDAKGRHLGDVVRNVPVDASGGFEHTDDPQLVGDVNGAIELLRKIAGSERVEQVFVRHAFRYWMGRNETPGDAPSLQAAHRAYRESGGSMQELIVALLTSDSFLYRVQSG